MGSQEGHVFLQMLHQLGERVLNAGADSFLGILVGVRTRPGAFLG